MVLELYGYVVTILCVIGYLGSLLYGSKNSKVNKIGSYILFFDFTIGIIALGVLLVLAIVEAIAG